MGLVTLGFCLIRLHFHSSEIYLNVLYVCNPWTKYLLQLIVSQVAQLFKNRFDASAVY